MIGLGLARGLAWAGLLLLLDAALTAGPGRGGWLVAPAFADDDDDDDDRAAPRRRTPPRALPPRRVAPPPNARREFVASSVTEADLARLRAAGFTVIATRRLAILPAATVRLRAPAALSETAALARLRALAPAAIVDVNHLYRPNADPCPPEDCFPFTAGTAFPAGRCALHGRIGMIDTAVDRGHPALRGRAIDAESIRSAGFEAPGSGHGTEIAILLTGAATPESTFTLVALDPFHRRGNADYADAFDVAAALDRLVQKSVTIANLSFAGPPNAVLDRAGAIARERGVIAVAAAGNDGPTAAPGYPAAYPWAIAVTAVDRRERIYPRAGRGPHLAFAAAGVRVQLPDRAMAPGPVRSGTSYAAPLVTAALAAARIAKPEAAPAALIDALALRAKDLGAPGRDAVFGFGLLEAAAACAAR